MRGTLNLTALAANFCYNSLFNNSTGAEVLVVRSLTTGVVSSLTYQVQWIHGSYGTDQGIVSPVLADSAAKPGRLFGNKTTTVPVPDLIFGTGAVAIPSNSGYPIAIIPPLWSLAVTTSLVNLIVNLGWLWEAVPAEELVDFGIDPMVAYAPRVEQS